MDAAEVHRQHIDRWFYDCGHETHRGLSGMYVSDDRFRAHYDERSPGLSGFIRDAAYANSERASGNSPRRW